jgi:hypothetical protein
MWELTSHFASVCPIATIPDATPFKRRSYLGEAIIVLGNCALGETYVDFVLSEIS